MREIKFKGFDKILKKMLSVSVDLSIREYWFWLGLKDVILIQYIGLKDKNGIEIYEGDIVQVNWIKQDNNIADYIGQVSYDYGKFWIVKHNGYGGIGYDFDRLLNSDIYEKTAELKVIGNIYENTELLKYM